MLEAQVDGMPVDLERRINYWIGCAKVSVGHDTGLGFGFGFGGGQMVSIHVGLGTGPVLISAELRCSVELCCLGLLSIFSHKHWLGTFQDCRRSSLVVNHEGHCSLIHWGIGKHFAIHTLHREYWWCQCHVWSVVLCRRQQEKR